MLIVQWMNNEPDFSTVPNRATVEELSEAPIPNPKRTKMGAKAGLSGSGQG